MIPGKTPLPLVQYVTKKSQILTYSKLSYSRLALLEVSALQRAADMGSSGLRAKYHLMINLAGANMLMTNSKCPVR
jgi:hypothetical protein